MASMDVDEEVLAAAETPAGPSHRGRGVPLHRVRFVDWAPSAISALSFLPVPQHVQVASSTRSLLAVGRENGNIDLCTWVEDDAIDSSQAKLSSSAERHASAPIVAKGWVVDTTLVGSNPSKVDSLVFLLSPTQPYPTPRLFSTSGGSIVTEHFLPPHLLLGGQSDSSRIGQELPASVRKASTLGSKSRSIVSQGGVVWAIAASPLGRHLAIACDDGVVRIIDIEDGRFELLAPSRSAHRFGGDGAESGVVSAMDRAKTRIVSLVWGPPRKKAKQTPKKRDSDESESESDEDIDDWEDTFILGGTTQSSALTWSTATGRVITKLLVERTRKEHSIVWSVATMPDGACVLGDSLGHVSFFDSRTYTLIAGAKFASHGRGADVLSLCVGPDGRSVYSASVDQKVVEYAMIGNGKTARWVQTGRRRLHAHDIRALAIDPPYDPRSCGSKPLNRLPVLVSGGVDFHLVLTPASAPSHFTILASSQNPTKKQDSSKGKLHTLKSAKYDHVNPISTTAVTTFADTIHRRLPFVPSSGKGSLLGGGSVIRVCPERRWVVARREKAVAIWKLPDTASADEEEGFAKEDNWKKVLEIQAKVHTNIVCVEISSDGRFLLIADLYESKLFELRGDGDDVLPRRVRSFSETFSSQGVDHCPGCSAATFTPDNARLVLASQPGSFLHVIELPPYSSNDKCTLLKSFAEHRQLAAGRAVAGKVARTSNGAFKVTKVNGAANGSAKKGAYKEQSVSSEDEEERDEDDANEVDNNTQTERTTFARIDIVQVSPDGQYLVSVDTAKRIHCYSLDTLHHRGAMPSPAHQPNSVVFDPWRPSRLCCVLPTNRVVLLDLENRQPGGLSQGGQKKVDQESSKEDGFVASLNERLAGVRDSAIGAFWLAPTVFIVWGATFMCTARFINKQRPSGADEAALSGLGDKPRKGKRTLDDDGMDITQVNPSDRQAVKPHWYIWLLTKYQPVLHIGTIPRLGDPDQRELVVVERPYYDVARSLPPTWFGGAAYGT